MLQLILRHVAEPKKVNVLERREGVRQPLASSPFFWHFELARTLCTHAIVCKVFHYNPTTVIVSTYDSRNRGVCTTAAQRVSPVIVVAHDGWRFQRMFRPEMQAAGSDFGSQ